MKPAPRPSHTSERSPKLVPNQGIQPLAQKVTSRNTKTEPTSASQGLVSRSVRLVSLILPVSRRAWGRKSRAMKRITAGMASGA